MFTYISLFFARTLPSSWQYGPSLSRHSDLADMRPCEIRVPSLVFATSRGSPWMWCLPLEPPAASRLLATASWQYRFLELFFEWHTCRSHQQQRILRLLTGWLVVVIALWLARGPEMQWRSSLSMTLWLERVWRWSVHSPPLSLHISSKNVFEDGLEEVS